MNLRPDFDDLYDMAANGAYQHEGMMVSAYTEDQDSRYDLHVRVFLPITGVNEDVACGSGNCSIIPYWYERGYGSTNSPVTAVFPYPEGPEGTIGGVQDIDYDPEEGRITIVAKASYIKAISVPDQDRRLNADLAEDRSPSLGAHGPKAQ
jgi:hypothetical protein